MPQKDIEKSSKPGFHTVSFDKTPIMSTYLLAWAVGDFEHIEAFTERKYNGRTLPVRLYTTRGLASQGQFALEHAPKIIDYYSEIFGIDYPLPKSDILAVHEFVSTGFYSPSASGRSTVLNRKFDPLHTNFVVSYMSSNRIPVEPLLTVFPSLTAQWVRSFPHIHAFRPKLL